DPLQLPPSVLSLEAGPPGLPIAVLTDDGVSALSLFVESAETDPAGKAVKTSPAPPDTNGAGTSPFGGAAVVSGGSSNARAPGGSFRALTPLIADGPVLAGSKSLIPRLDMVRDLDGDGTWDLMLPARDGLAVYMTTRGGELATKAASRIPLPGDVRTSGVHPSRSYQRPALGDLDGDGKPDLLFIHGEKGNWGKVVDVMRGEGGGRFGPPQRIAIDRLVEDSKAAIAAEAAKGSKSDHDHFGDGDEDGFKYFGDLTGDGLAEAVFAAEVDNGKSGLKQVKEPEFEYRFYHVG